MLSVQLAVTVKHPKLTTPRARTRVLLVAPRFPEGFWTFSWVFRHVITDRAAVNPPIGLATIAALCPAHWDVHLVDENVEEIDFMFDADIVAVGGMSVQHGRQAEIMRAFRARGLYVVCGGSFATLCPEEYADFADTVVIGESEITWPTFCRDYDAGQPKSVYQEMGDVPLALSPVPRHDLLKWDRYLAGAIQFSRGCPFLCEFCDIIVMFSRKPRQKSLDQVEAELDSMRRHGVRNVVFVDDNLIGHPAQCKALLQFLVDYQRRHRYGFVFGAEITINVANHPDLLTLMRQANFAWLFIGIETPNKAALTETRKMQNVRHDLLTSIRTIYRHGIDIFAGFIVGFDADDATIFDQQADFIVEAGIIVAMVGMLMAPPRTPLFERLKKAGRLVPDEVAGQSLINAGLATNIVPLQMTREQLYAGTIELHRRLLDDRNIYRRLCNKMRELDAPPNYHFKVGEWWSIFAGLMVHGIIKGGPRRWGYFAATLLFAMREPLKFGRTIRTLVANWSYALSLRDYLEGTLAAQARNVPQPAPAESASAPLAAEKNKVTHA